MFLHDRNNHRETLIAVTWPSTMASILLLSPEDAAWPVRCILKALMHVPLGRGTFSVAAESTG